MTTAINGTAVDLTSSPPLAATDSPEPVISLHTLASGLDANPLDIPSFLTSLLPPSASLSDLDTSLNDLLTRLTLLSQDTSSALEQSISDISRTVPRLNYDLQFMRESAATLQSSLDSVQGRVKRVEEAKREGEGSNAASTKSLDKLAHLDKLKTRMESARDILREAESWSTLESEITSSISSSEWEKAGARLAEAERSMVVFQSTPGEYESRKALLVSLQNGLEAALATALEQALEAADADKCARFYGVFESMGREAEFRNYYYTQRRKGVLDEWAAFEGGDGLAGFLPHFYTVLGHTLEKEVEQIGRIYPAGSGQGVLAAFIQRTLEGLSPSLQTRLGSMADAQGPTALPELIKAYKATEEVSLAIHAILDRMATEAPPLSPNTPTRATPRKRDFPRSVSDIASQRASQLLSSPEKRSNSSINPDQWESTLFESFLDLQSAYSTLERRYLLHLLRSHSSSAKRDANALSDRSVSMFSMAGDAISRCMAFTHGYGAPGLLIALGDFLASFLEGSHSVLDVQPVVVQDELDFGMDYSTEDWTAFQSGLHVLKVCRDISGRLSSFEEKLRTSLDHALDPPPPTSTPTGAVELLRQSTLNSSDLHTLISSPPRVLLPPATKALSDLTAAAQISLSSIILSPLRSALSTYPSLPVWSSQPRTARRDGLSIPTFSLSPTDTIARVSEGLLNLLRVFEVYAKDPALGHSLATLPFIPASALPPASSTPAAPELVLSTWIASLALTLLAHLTRTTLPSLPRLTTPGANQLAADLGYLGNAVRALDVEWADLERWREGAEMDESGWKAKMTAESGGEGAEVWVRIGDLRGWTA
ncbi:Golgi complex component 7-domain-containing protein [Dioszegia hungarica]|uniref:Conserved oligomeric Golgi complex subunit 7 n=1 Tax=Dioszegia hungarica TaxID=4972 RepID=A0AA38LUG6_9TREE|nr:Golgi complex component 7-domain-containing protein [Dioszegia hungarica]KAI9635670.1 Golgi complex component 7-domain-containing protein [Dioszegia hungarica]